MNDVDRLTREMKRAASLFIAARATGDYRKMEKAAERLMDLSSNFIDKGGSIEELANTLASGQGKGE